MARRVASLRPDEVAHSLLGGRAGSEALVVGEQVMEEAVAVGQERSRQLVLLALLVGCFDDAVVREDIDACVGIAKDDRRVARDDELRPLGDEIMHPPDQREAAAQRERGLGLVEEIEPLGPKRFITSERNDSPCDCSWRETPP